MEVALARTPLYDWHAGRGARMVDFAGWSMPVQYSSIVDEHNATRTGCGVFDISHMGRLRFDGDGAEAFLDRLLTRRVVGLADGLIRYSLITNEQGGILDDVLIYHLEDSDGKPFHLLVVNASNREKIVAWVEQHLDDSSDVQFSDQTFDTAMIAIQGPKALSLLDPLCDLSLSEMRYYSGQSAEIAGHQGFVSRTGYTGEDGFELIVPVEVATSVVEQLFATSSDDDLQPVGLGARDTLRLEAAMPLYGHELSELIDPFQAGLGFAVHLKDRKFIGSEALRAIKSRPRELAQVGLELAGKRVPREHYPVIHNDEPVGEVTSGTFSPTLQRPIAMAYVKAAAAEPGTELTVDIRGRQEGARVVALPFYKRET